MAAGRKRKPGPRENGRLISHEPREHAGYSPTSIKRLVDASVSGMADPQWATPFGKMHLSCLYNATQYAAGLEWGVLYHGWLRAARLSGMQIKSAQIGGVPGGEEPDPDTDAGAKIAKKDQSAMRRFEEAHKALKAAGDDAVREVRRLCEPPHGRPDDHPGLLASRRGLDALAAHFQGVRKAAQKRRK